MAPTLVRILGALTLIAAVLNLAPATANARELRIAVGAIGQVSGNPYSGLTVPETYLSSALFDGLTRFDKNGRLVPGLATSWRQVNPTSWSFNLRRGVVFSNGEPFTADAVIAALTWLKSESGAQTPAAAEIADIATADADDEHTLIVHTSRPDPILPQRLAAIMIVAPNAWQEMGPEEFAAHPSGTGPYTLASRNVDSITLAAISTAWRKPHADRIVLQSFAEPALQAKALLGGRVDIATAVDLDELGALQDQGFLVNTTPAQAVMAILLRQDDTKPALRDARVRRALNYAVDKGVLHTLALHGLGVAAGQPAARATTGYNPDVEPYPFDAAKARDLLMEAGVGPGFTLRVDAALDQTPGDRAILENLVAQMAAVGVEMQLHRIDANAASAEAVGGWNADTDGLLIALDAAPLNDMAQPLLLFSCASAIRISCNPALSAPIAASDTEMDDTRRLARLGDLAQTLHDDPPVIYLNELFDLFAVSSKVESFALAARVPVYENITLRP